MTLAVIIIDNLHYLNTSTSYETRGDVDFVIRAFF